MLRTKFYLFTTAVMFAAQIYLNAQPVEGPILTAPADGALSISVNAAFAWDPVPSADAYIIYIATDTLFTNVVASRQVDTTVYTSSALSNNTQYYWRVVAKIGSSTSDYSDFFGFKTKLSIPVPSSPGNLTTSQPLSLNLTWASVTGANTYSVDISPKNDFSDSVDTYAGLAVTTQAIAGLSYYRTYYWRVKAFQAGGNTSDYSVTKSFTTIKAGPGLTSPGNNVVSYAFSKVTYTWGALAGMDSYELQVCKSNTFSSDVKTYASATNTYTPAADYLEYNTKYYWRVRGKAGAVYTDYSVIFNFTVGTPGTLINTADARILFEHTEGRIKEITFKRGSNKQLLDTLLNERNKTGLGRVSNETSTKLTSWIENPGNYIYNYENTSYGSKTLNIKFNVDSIVVKLTLNLAANKSGTVTAALRPGGDADPINDSVMYATPSGEFYKLKQNYPGAASTIFNGYTVLTSMYDNRYPNEFAGYLSPDSASTLLQQAVAFGPTFTFSATPTAQVKTISFGIMTKQGFFDWANKKYFVINTPAGGDKLQDQSSVAVRWESFGVTGNVDIALSVNGGTTFPASLAAATANDGYQVVTLPDLSASVPLANCKIKITGTGANRVTDTFSIISAASCIFTIPQTITGSPTDKIYVPVLINPTATDPITAIDMRIEYNKDLLAYNASVLDPEFVSKNWTTDMTNNLNFGYLQFGGFKNSAGTPVSAADTLFVLTFSIKSAARVGIQVPLRINNQYLSAANDSAHAMNVIGRDGAVTIYTRITGNLLYQTSKKPITGTGIVKLYTYNTLGVLVDSAAVNSSAAGFFDFSNQVPGSTTVLKPVDNLAYPAPVSTAVDALDARKAFDGREGVTSNLTELQRAAADINDDGIINSTDALGILKISTGELTAADFGVNKWTFVDSTYKINITNWYAAPHFITYAPLDTIKTKQTFWGMIRGDVDGDGFNTPYALPKYNDGGEITGNPASVVYSVPPVMNIRPGDTLYLPVNVKLATGKTIGAFNTSITLDKKMLSYAGYQDGAVIPASKGWVLSSYFDTTGTLNIGATDFSSSVDAITSDGTLAYFRFVVNNSAGYGDTIPVKFQYITSADGSLQDVSASGTDGKIVISDFVSSSDEEVIDSYTLEQNYPNPFNPVTTISYSLQKESKVTIEVFNVVGERAALLVNDIQQKGRYSVKWDASSMASGVYMYRINAGSFIQTRKMVLIK